MSRQGSPRPALPEGVFRYVWPQRVVCPGCGHPHIVKKITTRGRKRTQRCPACAYSWASIATVAEVDQGGGVGAIVVI